MTRFFHDYMAYGLHFHSAIRLPSTLSLGSYVPTGEPDVIISLGKTPAKLPNPIKKKTRKPPSLGAWEIAKDTFLLDVPGVARYLASGGRHITVERYSNDNYKIGVFLTGILTSILLQQRGIITFHASSITTEVGAILFPGASGVGKSSLVASLVNRGYSMLADDLTGVTFDADGRLTVQPAFPCLRLRADTLDMLGWRERAQTCLQEGFEKYRLLVEQTHHTQVPIHSVYLLAIHDLSDITIKRLPIADAFKWLYKHTYQKSIMKGWGHQLKFFRTLETISKTKQAFLVQRPMSPFSLDILADHIDASLRGEPLPAGERHRDGTGRISRGAVG